MASTLRWAGPNFVAMKVCRINFHRHTVFVTFVVVR